uniref:HTH psq-type domain-containing protein n=1 Tax=Cacopsylla melanoneura TaxID=428564 RepID=A0A8D8WWT3_9HEMI
MVGHGMFTPPPAAPPKNTGKKKLYPPEAMALAIKAVFEKQMGWKKASKTFGVPKTTLINRCHNLKYGSYRKFPRGTPGRPRKPTNLTQNMKNKVERSQNKNEEKERSRLKRKNSRVKIEVPSELCEDEVQIEICEDEYGVSEEVDNSRCLLPVDPLSLVQCETNEQSYYEEGETYWV